MYHIFQQACNALLVNMLKAGRWLFYIPAIYQPSTSHLPAGCSQHQLSFAHLCYYSALFQSKSPLPSSSSSMPNPMTLRLSALKGSMY